MSEQLKQVLSASIEEAYHNQNLGMEDIVEIMQMTRQVYEIDGIVIHTNRTYKYQLDHIVTCNESGAHFFDSKEVMLTGEQYDELVENYSKRPVDDVPLAPFKGMAGSVLHAALLRGGRYFGTVAFWCKEKRTWGEAEKKTVSELAHLMFLFISMSNMLEGMNAYKQAKQALQDDKVLSGFFLNLINGSFHAMKLVPFLQGKIPEWSDYNEIINLYSKEYTDPIYGKHIKEKFNLDSICKAFSQNQRTLELEYPRVFDGEVRWIIYRTELISSDESGRPLSALVTFYDNTEGAQRDALLSGVSKVNDQVYNLISVVDLDAGKYGIYMDNSKDSFVTEECEPFGDYDELYSNIVARNMERQYAAVYEELFSIENLRKHFDKSEEPIDYEFSSNIDDETIWVKLESIRMHDYIENGRKVLIYCSNITKQKREALRLKARNEALEKEKRENQYLLEHDPLTGALNRVGYKRILKQYESEELPVAYVQIDVDDFKTLNDTQGHAFGDEVLMQVTKQIQETFRREDYVFRFGGDEFAVLLTGCRNDIWETIADKQRLLHIKLNQLLKTNTYITLSMGISWSESGFNKELISLADAALFKTKANGRSGLCVFDKEHHTVFEWHDEFGRKVDTSFGARSQSITGECRLELNDDDWSRGRLICNEAARVLMGFSKDNTPEECFSLWAQRIDPYSRETLRKTGSVMIEKGQAECSYMYKHPLRGKISMRCGGRCLKNDTGIVFYGYNQSMEDTNIVLGQDDSQHLINAMTALYFASYYVSLVDDWFCIFKSTAESRHLDKQDVPASVAIKNFVATMVQPECRDEMYEFVDFETLPTRLQNKDFVEAEYKSMVEDKGWCRMRMLAVKRDESGRLTHFQILVASIDKQKRETSALSHRLLT